MEMSAKESKNIRSKTITRYRAEKSGDVLCKGQWIGSVRFLYDENGAVIGRDDIDEAGKPIENPDRKLIYSSDNKLKEEQFYDKEGQLYRRIRYRALFIIEERWSSEKLRFMYVRHTDMDPDFYLAYVYDTRDRCLEFVENNHKICAHIFSEYEYTERGYCIEKLYFEDEDVFFVYHIHDNNFRYCVTSSYVYNEEMFYKEYGYKIEPRRYVRKKNILETVRTKVIKGGKSPKYVEIEYFDGIDTRYEIHEYTNIVYFNEKTV